MHLNYKTSFTVYPEDTNIHTPLIFGGAFFSYMDKAAAVAVRRLLYDSNTCKSAVTHKVENLTFHKPCYTGDLIHIDAQITELGVKSVVIQVTCHRERDIASSAYERSIIRDSTLPELELVATAKFIFVTTKSDLGGMYPIANKPHLLPYAPHGLKLPETT